MNIQFKKELLSFLKEREGLLRRKESLLNEKIEKLDKKITKYRKERYFPLNLLFKIAEKVQKFRFKKEMKKLSGIMDKIIEIKMAEYEVQDGKRFVVIKEALEDIITEIPIFMDQNLDPDLSVTYTMSPQFKKALQFLEGIKDTS